MTRLVGGPEMFVESSSMINLTCLVAWTAKPPDKVSLSPGDQQPGELAQVVWLHNGSEVTYNGPRTGVSLITDKSEVENACTKKTQMSCVLILETFKVTTVTLLLQRATNVDSGSYTCRLRNPYTK